MNPGANGYGQAPGQPIQPEIVTPGGPAFYHPMASLIPQFPQLASKVDVFASRFPWYLWFVAGAVVLWWAGKRGYLKKLERKALG